MSVGRRILSAVRIPFRHPATMRRYAIESFPIAGVVLAISVVIDQEIFYGDFLKNGLLDIALHLFSLRIMIFQMIASKKFLY